MPEKKVKPYVAKDQADFAYRQQMYSDSLILHNIIEAEKDIRKSFSGYSRNKEDNDSLLNMVSRIPDYDYGVNLAYSPGFELVDEDISTQSPTIANSYFPKPTQEVVRGDYPDEEEGGMLDSAIGFMADPATTRPSFPTRQLITKEDGTVDWLAEEEGGHLTKPILRPYQENGKTMLRFEKDHTTPGYVPGPINFESGGMTYGHYPKMDPIDVPVFNRENKIWEQPPSLNPMDVEDYDLDIDTIVAIQEGTASDEFVRPNVSNVKSDRHWATANFPGEAPKGMSKKEYEDYFFKKGKYAKDTRVTDSFKYGGALNRYGNGGEIGDLPLTPPSPAPIDNTYTNITTPNYTSEEMAQMISDQQDLEDKALLEEIEMQTSSLSDMWGDTKAFGDSFLNAWDLDQIKSENRLLKNNADIDWQDDYYADTFELEDPRVIRATTGDSINPNVDLKGGHYNKQVVSGIVDRALKLGVDPYEAIAVGLQESLLGKRDPNLGHVQDATADEKGLDIVNDPFAFVDILKDKLNWAEKDSVFDRASALQYYNGTGPLFPETEQGYHGYKMQKAYGVPIPKEGLSMKEHPLYGKEIGDIIEGILKHNTYINELISSK